MENTRNLVLASLVADSLALGVHWVYNTGVINRKYGRVEELIAPQLASYHKGKEAGDQTHYGDQTLWLLESLAEHGGWDRAAFAQLWRQRMSAYDGYMDKASQTTLDHLAAGQTADQAGSNSTDLSAAGRIAPLVCLYHGIPKLLFEVVREQAALTHDHPDVLDAAEFWARVTVEVLAGVTPAAAMGEVAKNYFGNRNVVQWTENGLASAGRDTHQTVADLGQACPIEQSFPSTVHLVASYPDDLKTALVENVMAGGDSAARGLIVGMVLGAAGGVVPAGWMAAWRHRAQAEGWLDRLAQSKEK